MLLGLFTRKSAFAGGAERRKVLGARDAFFSASTDLDERLSFIAGRLSPASRKRIRAGQPRSTDDWNIWAPHPLSDGTLRPLFLTPLTPFFYSSRFISKIYCFMPRELLLYRGCWFFICRFAAITRCFVRGTKWKVNIKCSCLFSLNDVNEW